MTSDTDAGARLLGSLRSENGSGVVRIEHRYEADVADVWSAITDPQRLALWYGRVEGDLRLGGEFRLHIEPDGWYGTGRIDVCEPAHRLAVTTRETDESFQAGNGAAPFDDVIEVVLTADGDRTALVLEIRGLPLDKIAYYGVGWQIHAESLANHLAGRERGDTESRWDVLIPPYKELAAKIGS